MNSIIEWGREVLKKVLIHSAIIFAVVFIFFAAPSIVHAADPASGVATSTIVDLGSTANFGTITWSDTVPANTSVVMEVRAGNQADLSDGVWTTVAKNDALGANFDGMRYYQYRATLATTNGDAVPSLDDVTITWLVDSTYSLISSPYDTTDAANILASIGWTATVPEGTTVKFQVRSSADNSTWTSWMGPDGTNGTYFTDSTGAQAMPAALTSGGDDRWIQYQVFLTNNYLTTPTLQDVTLTYVVNAPPEISITTDVVEQATDGTVTINYNVRDVDNSSGGTNGNVTVDLQYCTSNCSNPGSEVWEVAAAPSLSGTFGSSVPVNIIATTTYTSYTLVWTPTVSYNNQFNNTDFKIRLRVNDSEPANNYGYDESNTFTLDTTDPIVNRFALDARSDATSSLTISVSDDTVAGLLMKLSNNSGLTSDGVNANSGTWIPLTATSSWTFASGASPIVYYQIKDAYGNISAASAISSLTSPQNPLNVVFRDISNADTSEWREFIAWGVVPEPAAGFLRYTIYRSTDGVTYTAVATQVDSAINYYFDQNLVEGGTYYYKVTAEDLDHNISKYSSIVSDTTNGQGGSDITGPTITNVATSTVGTQSATITWDTDELSSSYVDYHTITGGDFSAGPSVGVTTVLDNSAGLGVHSVVLTGLTPDTTYYFRVRSLDPDSNEGIGTFGSDGYSFRTLAGPAISNVAVSNVVNKSATVTWTTDQNSDSYVYYSTSSLLASPTIAGTAADSVTSHSVVVSNLTSDTTYYYYVKSGVAEDKNVVEGVVTYYNFGTTADLTAPTITFDSNADVVVSDTTANVSWTTNEAATSTLEYGTSNEYGTLAVNDTYNSEHAFALTGLLQGTLYYVRIKSADVNQNISSATEFTFTTTDSRDVTAPAITVVTTTVITDTEALITWTTDEGATSKVWYGTATGVYGSSSVLDTAKDFKHAVTISDLTVLTPYYYIVVSTDLSGNTSTSTESTFTTLDTLSEESAVLLREEIARAEGQASGASGSGGGGSSSSVDRTAPVIKDVVVGDISGSGASVSWSADENSVGIMEYGTSQQYSQSAITIPLTFNKKHQITLTDLLPLTTYYYRVSAADSSFNLSNTLMGSFTTLGAGEGITPDSPNTSTKSNEEIFVTSIQKASDFIKSMSTQVNAGVLETTLIQQAKFIEELSQILPLPIIGGQPLVEVGSNYANISWTTDKLSNSLVDFAPANEFSLTTEYSQTVGVFDVSTNEHTVSVKGLLPNTAYHYRVVSRTPTGAETKSQDFTFKTKTEFSEIGSYKATVMSPEEVSFFWVTNLPSDSVITYTPYRNGELNPDARQIVRKPEISTEHLISLSNLESGVIYDIELSGTDYGGNVISKTIQGFSTENKDVPPLISQVKTDSAIIPGGKDKIQEIISWTTNEMSTSRVLYRKGFAKEGTEFTESTALDSSYVKKHIVVISNFEPGMVYQFVVESTDSGGNTATSKTITVLTPRKQESVFQVIMNNVEEMFSWTGKINK